MGLKKENRISHFVWKEWLDVATGFMVGCNDPSGKNDKIGGLARCNGGLRPL